MQAETELLLKKARGCVVLHAIKISHQSTGNGNTSSGILLHECARGLVEECEVSGFANSGVQITSCEAIVVRKNNLRENNSGIETENCAGVDINDNTIEKNQFNWNDYSSYRFIR